MHGACMKIMNIYHLVLEVCAQCMVVGGTHRDLNDHPLLGIFLADD